jgi:hypothetical protein
MSWFRALWITVVLGLGLALASRPATASPAPADGALVGALEAGQLALQRPTGCVATLRGLRRDLAVSQTDWLDQAWQPAPGGTDTPSAAPPPSDTRPPPASDDAGTAPAPDPGIYRACPRSSGCRGPPSEA